MLPQGNTVAAYCSFILLWLMHSTSFLLLYHSPRHDGDSNLRSEGLAGSALPDMMRGLIYDDEEALLLLLDTVLHGAGYEVLEARWARG